jgi:two-component system sensor histidine kinase YesM
VNETMHIGIFNIARRIQLMYGEGYGLTIDSRKGEGTRVTLTLPATEARP